MKQDAKRKRLAKRQNSFNSPQADRTRQDIKTGARRCPGSYRL